MHAHPDPRRLLAAVAAAFALMLAALAMPPAVGELDLRLGGGSEAAPTPAAAPAARVEQPRWVAHPMTPPALTR